METGDDTPLRLADALVLAFPNGGMTVSGLRREARRGRLRIERIANKDFTTLTAIREMRERCRIQAVAKVNFPSRADDGDDKPPIRNYAVRDAALRRLREQRRQAAEQDTSVTPREALLAHLASRKGRK